MKTNKKILNILAVIFFSAIFALQNTKASEQVSVDNSLLTLNGLAVENELRKEWFLSALYLSSKSSNTQAILNNSQVKRMQIKVLASNLSSRRLKRYWIERIKNNNEPSKVLENAKSVRVFSNLMNQNLKENDVIDIDFLPNRATVISINGFVQGRLNSKLFNLILNTWIGERPPTSEFKDNILGIKSNSNYQNLLAKLSAIQPSSSRLAYFQTPQTNIVIDDDTGTSPLITQQDVSITPERTEVTESNSTAQNPDVQLEQSSSQQVAEANEVEKKRKQAELQAQRIAQRKAAEKKAQLTAARTKAIKSARKEYRKKIRLHFAKFFEYPEKKITKRYGRSGNIFWQEGKTHGRLKISLELDEEGQINRGGLVSSLGEKIIDDAVLNALFDAAPYPIMPKELAGSIFKSTFTIYIPNPSG